MARACSLDLRERVVAAVRSGRSCRQVAVTLGSAQPSWLRAGHRHAAGCRSDRTRGPWRCLCDAPSPRLAARIQIARSSGAARQVPRRRAPSLPANGQSASGCRTSWRSLRARVLGTSCVLGPRCQGCCRFHRSVVVPAFVQQRLKSAQGMSLAAKELRAVYEAWCATHGYEPLSPQKFAAELKRLGCDKWKSCGLMRYRDLEPVA